MPDRLVGWLLYFGSVLILLAWAPCAVAAGGWTPPPIRLCEVGLWLDTRLTVPPTTEERRAIIAAHDRYWAAYRALDEGAIQAFTGANQSLWREPKEWPARRRATFALVDRMAQLDNSLFDAIEAALPEGRRAEFATARQARAIDRTLDTGALLGPGTLDLHIADIARRMQTLTPEERIAIEPSLRDHEARIAAIARDLLLTLRRAHDTADQRLAQRVEQGEPVLEAKVVVLTEVEAETPEWTALRRKLRAAVAACRADLNGMVSFEANRELAYRLYGRFADDSSLKADSIEPRLRVAVRRARSDEEQAAIMEIYRAWAKEDDAFVERILAQLLAAPAAHEIRVDLEPDFEPRQTIGASAMADLDRLLGASGAAEREKAAKSSDQFDDRLDVLRTTSIAASAERTADSPLLRRVATGSASASGNDGPDWRANWKPRPLDSATVLAWLAEASDDQRLIVSTAIQDGTARWRDAIAPQFAAVDAATRAMSERLRQRGAALPPDEAAYLDVANLTIAALDAAMASDHTTFEDLAAVVDPALARFLTLARCEREVAVYADGETLVGTTFGYEVLPNLPTLLRVATAPKARPAAEAVVLEMIGSLPTLARERRLMRLRFDARHLYATNATRAAQDDLRERERNGLVSPEEAAAETPRLDARREADSANRRADLDELARQGAAWRDTFDRMLERIAASAGEGFSDDDRIALRIAYERSVAPLRFRDLRDPSYLFARARASFKGDPERLRAIDDLEGATKREVDSRFIANIDSFRAHPITLVADWDMRGLRREAFLRADRDQLHTRAVWALRAMVPVDQPALARAMREYDRSCVLAGTSWWDE